MVRSNATGVADTFGRDRFQAPPIAPCPEGADISEWNHNMPENENPYLERGADLVDYGSGIPEHEIRVQAYLNWEAAGKPEGGDSSFWLQAKEQLHALDLERAQTENRWRDDGGQE